ncbi:MAG TPA: STAS domain-containing protein [Actinomycetales bacterium]|nr:STAS domain-containing protein [Actinomycetales bacterium]
MELSVTAEYGGGMAVVEVEGALDAFTAPFFGDYLDLVRGAAGPRLVLRLGGLSFVDCAGLRTLLAARAEAVSGGGWLRLEAVPAGARRVMALTGTQVLLQDDVGAARLHGAEPAAGR